MDYTFDCEVLNVASRVVVSNSGRTMVAEFLGHRPWLIGEVSSWTVMKGTSC